MNELGSDFESYPG
jgi:hypothetical protein